MSVIDKMRKRGLTRETAYGGIGMRKHHLFVIDSNSSEHSLALDGKKMGTFTTLNAAESKAGDIARFFHAAATPRFELDFAWTLSDAKVRTASLEW